MGFPYVAKKHPHTKKLYRATCLLVSHLAHSSLPNNVTSCSWAPPDRSPIPYHATMTTNVSKRGRLFARTLVRRWRRRHSVWCSKQSERSPKQRKMLSLAVRCWQSSIFNFRYCIRKRRVAEERAQSSQISHLSIQQFVRGPESRSTAHYLWLF